MPAEEDEPAPRRVGVIAVGATIGVIIGLAVALVLDDGTDADVPSVVRATDVTIAPETPEAAEEFIAAWERSRRAPYIAVTEWHRVAATGAEATQRRILAQRLPDRVRSGDHSRQGRIDGLLVTCDRLPLTDEQLGADGEPRVECREEPLGDAEAVDVDALVDQEVALMWNHVEGTRPLYRVGQWGNCFFLRLARPMVVPPYGTRTTYCFDEDTGAVRRFRIDRDEGTDTEELLWVTSEVTDEDLRAVLDGSFEPPRPGEETTGTEATR